MYNGKMTAYLDFELTQRLESFVINALPQRSRQSDFNMIYLASLEVDAEDGKLHQSTINSEDSMFLTFINEFGRIDYEFIKMAHIAGVIESDFEIMSYLPSLEDMPKFANYYIGKEVPIGGGFLQFAICPFGINKVQLLNDDEIEVYGNGRVWITDEQRGFKKYLEIPKVDKVLGHNYYKILKLAIYTRYSQFTGSTLSMNLYVDGCQYTKPIPFIHKTNI